MCFFVLARAVVVADVGRRGRRGHHRPAGPHQRDGMEAAVGRHGAVHPEGRRVLQAGTGLQTGVYVARAPGSVARVLLFFALTRTDISRSFVTSTGFVIFGL